jgi:hypothetical protein
VEIGVYWAPAVLEHKLERRHQPGPVEEVWNCRRLPTGLGRSQHGDRLLIASAKRWVGFVLLSPEVLYTPNDPACPYALIFDVTTWASIPITIPCKPFRGWTYKIPDALTLARSSIRTT